MDDVASMITQFLNSEEGMAQLRAVSEALGLGDVAAGQSALPNQGAAAGQGAAFGGFGSPAPFPPAGQAAAPPFASAGQGSPPPAYSSAGQSSPPLDFNTMMMLSRALSGLNRQDKSSELLRALKPHLSAGRAKRVDDAIRIIQLLRLLPLLKDMGLFEGAKGGGQ